MLKDREVIVFSPVEKSGMIFSCENTVVSTMPIGSMVSDLLPSFEGFSVTPRPASSVWNGGGKNSLWCLRRGSPNLLRPQGPACSGSFLRRHAGVPSDPDPPSPVPGLRQGEAGVPGLSLRQPLLHEAVLFLRMAGTQEEQENPDRRDGHVEALHEVHEEEGTRPSGRDPVRQVSRHAPSWGGCRQGAPFRIPASVGKGQSLRQGTTVQPSLPVGKPLAQRAPGAAEIALREQAAPDGLPAQGIVRSTVGVPPRRVGTAVLRQLERIPQMAASQTLREVRRAGGAELERDRGVLRGGGGVLSRVRRGSQYQDPGHPAPGVRPSERRVPPPEGPHLHASRDLKVSISTHSITR